MALAAIAGFSAVHVVGVGPGRIVQNVLAGLKVLVLLAFVAFGFAIGMGSPANFTAGAGAGMVAPSSWVLALIPVMFSYSGWNAAAYVAGEIRDPGRNVPLALGVGTVTVVVLYLLLNMLYIYALPVAELAAVEVRVVDAAAERLFGAAVAAPLAAASVVMIAASISAMVLAGPRVYYAMAQDGQFFARLGRVHPRFRTPVGRHRRAERRGRACSCLTGTFDQLVAYTGFRRRAVRRGCRDGTVRAPPPGSPLAPRPFRAWGYPAAPFVFAAVQRC